MINTERVLFFNRLRVREKELTGSRATARMEADVKRERKEEGGEENR